METTPPQIDTKMIEMLVCPFTKTRLEWSKDRTELISHAAKLAFPIKDNIPMLTFDEARSLTDDEIQKIKR